MAASDSSGVLEIPESFIIVAIGFANDELAEIMPLVEAVFPQGTFALLELPTLDGFYALWAERSALDILFLRLFGASPEPQEEDGVLKLRHLTQQQIWGRLPLLLFVDTQEWTDLAYELGAISIMTLPVDQARLILALETVKRIIWPRCAKL